MIKWPEIPPFDPSRAFLEAGEAPVRAPRKQALRRPPALTVPAPAPQATLFKEADNGD